MKKTIPVLFFLLFANLLLFGQKFLVKLTFTAELNTQHIDLDSIHVRNMTQSADTVLYWPDTTLSFIFSGVGIPSQPGLQNDFTVRLLGNDEVSNNIRLEVGLPLSDDIRFQFTSLMGAEMGEFKFHQDKGYHTYLVSGGCEGIFLLSVRWNGNIKTLKIGNPNPGKSLKTQIRYEGNSTNYVHEKMSASVSSFPFAQGDSLEITGYKGLSYSRLLDNPTQSTNYLLPFGMNFPCPGIPSFTYGGQTYNTVQIGNQCWMKENLNIGTKVASIYMNNTSHSECADNGIIEKYCYLNMDANCLQYGGLYDWNEAMQYVLTPGA